MTDDGCYKLIISPKQTAQNLGTQTNSGRQTLDRQTLDDTANPGHVKSETRVVDEISYREISRYFDEISCRKDEVS
jgi:hypothetical protein